MNLFFFSYEHQGCLWQRQRERQRKGHAAALAACTQGLFLGVWWAGLYRPRSETVVKSMFPCVLCLWSALLH